MARKNNTTPNNTPDTTPNNTPDTTPNNTPDTTTETALTIPASVPPAIADKIRGLKSKELAKALTTIYENSMVGQEAMKQASFVIARQMVRIEEEKLYEKDGYKNRTEAIERTLGVKAAKASRDIKMYKVFGEADKRAPYDDYLYRHTPGVEALRNLSSMTPAEREKYAVSLGWKKQDNAQGAVEQAQEAAKEKPIVITGEMAETAYKAAKDGRPAPKHRIKPEAPKVKKRYNKLSIVHTWATFKTESTAENIWEYKPEESDGEYGRTFYIGDRAFEIVTTERDFRLFVYSVVDDKAEREAKAKRDNAINSLIAIGMTREEAEKQVDKIAAKKQAEAIPEEAEEAEEAEETEE